MRVISRIIYPFILLIISVNGFSQPVPNVDENIPYLMTFGKQAGTDWGDDDFSQAFFFQIPREYDQPFFIRVFDPDTGGKIDEINGEFNTRCVFEVYGGKGNWSDPDARETSPNGNYKSGTLLDTRAFTVNPRYDSAWFTFGPYNPAQGEYAEEFDSYIFKVICEGVSGDDGNMYRYFLSTSATENREIEGANAFAYEYSFRMHDDVNEVSHIYPYIDEGTVSIQIKDFDWDNDGSIVVISVERQGTEIKTSGQNDWAEDVLRIQEGEIGTSFDFRFVKARNLVKHNNVVVNVRNQYGETMPFYTIPLGGVPKYKGGGRANRPR